MMIKRTLIPALAIVAVGAMVIAPTFGGAAASSSKAEIGKPAPDFELPDCYGKKFKLSEFKGKVVVLEWLNRNCPVSLGKHNHQVMQNTLKQYAGRGVVWLGIDSTASLDAEENRVYAAQKGLAYPILNDPTGRVGHKYGAKATPHMFVIDRGGTLVYEGAIDGQQNGKPDDNFVADALEAVVTGSTVARAKTQPYGCPVKYAK